MGELSVSPTNVSTRFRTAFDAATIPINLVRGRWRARKSKAVVVHNGRFKAIPSRLVVSAFCHSQHGRLVAPKNLTILLVHNRPYKTLMEQSLDYIGIENYVVLRVPEGKPWRHSLKITSIRDYLKSGACRTEYVLFCDADDAVMRDDPVRAVEALDAAGCDMLVSCTAYARYQSMDEIAAWTRAIASAERARQKRGRIHLNSGVYVARSSFLLDFMEQAATFVTADDITGDVLYRMSDSEVRERLPEFPRGSGEDQLIFRYLFKQNYPRMQIDYAERVAIR